MAKFIFHTEWYDAFDGVGLLERPFYITMAVEMACRYVSGETRTELLNGMSRRGETAKVIKTFVTPILNDIDRDRREHPEIFKEE